MKQTDSKVACMFGGSSIVMGVGAVGEAGSERCTGVLAGNSHILRNERSNHSKFEIFSGEILLMPWLRSYRTFKYEYA